MLRIGAEIVEVIAVIDDVRVTERPGDQLFDFVMSTRDISVQFQQIVDLETGEVVAHEALVRGPEGSSLHSPAALFERARELGRVVELDVLCREAAIRAALAAGFSNPYSIFVDIEPESLADPGFSILSELRLGHVLEITNRDLLLDPAALIRSATKARRLGCRIAINVGGDPAALLLLPLLQPDVIKLDMGLIRERPTLEVARVMSAVVSQAEQSATVIIAEGIETERQRVTALAMGARYGQGWQFGRPGSQVFDAPRLAGVRFAPQRNLPADESGTPYSIASRGRTPRRSNRALLVEMSKFLETQARASGSSTMILATFQHQDNVTETTKNRYLDLGAHTGLAVVYAHGAPDFDGNPAVRTSEIDATDPLMREWNVVVVASDYAAVLTATEISAADHAIGEYEFVLTHDRTVAIRAARNLFNRLVA